MHYWLTYLSPLMIPTERPDNPFTSIIVPLALSTVDEQQTSSAMYSLSAFNQSSSSAFSVARRKQRHALGSVCLQVAFEELGRSLVKANHNAPEVILATILNLVIIGIFTDNYSNYRIHLRGGAEWIRSIDKSTWKHNHDASTIYQMFSALDALRPAHSILARDLGPQGLSVEYLSLDKTDGSDSTLNRNHHLADHEGLLIASSKTGSYCLDKIFALTKPVLECILQINRLVFTGVMPADGEFVSLEFKIMSSNPELLHFPSLTPAYEKVAQHHACTLWCALYIFYKSSLLKLPPADMQWLVRQSIKHLDAIESLTDGLTCSGLLWPLFIAASEAEDEDLRFQSIKVFEKRQQLGIANTTPARKVVEEVWRRRDQGDTDVSWHEVMAQLNIDILLS
ncbi:L-arabinose-responsive transcription regulator ARA1 [Hyphodiscus hymeniophilus]|uniref:L-arabinose-responsive transcription regulator ARA1 n=1 Tax=Hyphodiscus hymeniophilus TaxID=353542 RepID=A0A9P7AW14_9HELO|nr:L-arabinose-responsive transcription regulator ARA1 [Hyphodiscus hymeniophilus]